MSELSQMLVVGAAVGAAVAFVSTRAWRALQSPAAAGSGQCSTGCAGCPVARTLDSPDDRFAGCAGMERDKS
jgi:hypothetical protein